MTPSRRGFSLPDRIGRPVARGTYVAQIDGLRCLAIVAVLVWHVSLRASRHAGSIDAPQGSVTDLYGYIPHGEIGVALFFFVSGFVIAQPFLGRPRVQWRIGQFYLRRFRRIYPPYVIVLTFCFAVVAIGGFSRLPSDLSPAESWLASLLYLHGALFQQPSRLDPPVWSLEIEVQFYLLAPLIVALYLRPSRLAARIGSEAPRSPS